MNKFLLCFGLTFGFSAVAAPAPSRPIAAPKSLIRTYSALIETRYREFTRCQQADQLRSKRRVRGVVLLRYVVSTTGKVVEAGPLHNTTKSRFLADCLVRNLELITFPSPGLKPVIATHPFKFRPGAVPGKK